MARTTPLVSLISIITLSAPCLAQTDTTFQKQAWHFRGFADDNCQEELINETSEDPLDCTNTTTTLRSYRFSPTPHPDMGESFGLRLYVDQECNIPATIYDAYAAYEDGVGACKTTIPYQSWNTFPM